MKVYLISPEIAPFAETDLTARFSRNFPIRLLEDKHDIRLIMPKYSFISDRKYILREVIRLREIPVEWNGETRISSIKSGFVPDSKVQVYFLSQDDLFSGVDERIYKAKGARKALDDTDLRYSFFAKAALESLKHLHWQPDLIHCCGWPSAMVPILLKTLYKDDPYYNKIKVVFTPLSTKELTTFSANTIEYANIKMSEKNGADLSSDKKGNFSPTQAAISFSDFTIPVSSKDSKLDKDLKSDPGLAKAIKGKKKAYKALTSRFDEADDFVGITSSILDIYKEIIE